MPETPVVVEYVDGRHWTQARSLHHFRCLPMRIGVEQPDPAVAIGTKHEGRLAHAIPTGHATLGSHFDVHDGIHSVTGRVSQPRETIFKVRLTAGVLPLRMAGKRLSSLSRMMPPSRRASGAPTQ